METTSISLSGFVFLLLVIANGYILIEILGEKYFFKKSLSRHGDATWERFIHYFLAGLLPNLLVVILCTLDSGLFRDLLNMLKQAGLFASSLRERGEADIKIFTFAVLYDIVVLMWTLLLGFGIRHVISAKQKAKLKR